MEGNSLKDDFGEILPKDRQAQVILRVSKGSMWISTSWKVQKGKERLCKKLMVLFRMS